MTTTTTERYRVGDKVVFLAGYSANPHFQGVFTVRKVNPAKYLLDPINGGRGVNAPHYMVKAAPEGGAPEATTEFLPYRAPLDAGTLVRFDHPKAAGLYVVITDKIDRINIARLGGDGGKYWRAYPASVTVVDPAAVLREGVAYSP